MHQYNVKDAIFIGTKEVVPSEQEERVYGANPRVNEKQKEMFEIPGPDAIVHPTIGNKGGMGKSRNKDGEKKGMLNNPFQYFHNAMIDIIALLTTDNDDPCD